jgi:hypothetical protein
VSGGQNLGAEVHDLYDVRHKTQGGYGLHLRRGEDVRKNRFAGIRLRRWCLCVGGAGCADESDLLHAFALNAQLAVATSNHGKVSAPPLTYEMFL